MVLATVQSKIKCDFSLVSLETFNCEVYRFRGAVKVDFETSRLHLYTFFLNLMLQSMRKEYLSFGGGGWRRGLCTRAKDTFLFRCYTVAGMGSAPCPFCVKSWIHFLPGGKTVKSQVYLQKRFSR